jgi:hypothetical protein
MIAAATSVGFDSIGMWLASTFTTVQLLADWRLPEWPVYAVFPVKTQTYRLQTWCAELRQELARIPGVST